jgi:Calcineurin-like phosphoesterase
VFDWFLLSNLSRCFEDHPELRGLLYFNRSTGTLAMEDPQLKFYLRALDWPEFAEASGHGHVEFHPADGPLWPLVSQARIEPGGLEHASTESRVHRVLHLSDLHFATADQTTIWYSQLAADLRQQGVERLDALVVSGDLVNRASAAEYAAAGLFIEQVKSGFGLKAQAVVLVPGNHDVSWPLADSAYRLVRRGQVAGALAPGTYVEHTPEIIELRDDEAYRQRFAPFAEATRRSRASPTRWSMTSRQPSRRFRKPGYASSGSTRRGSSIATFPTAPASTWVRLPARCRSYLHLPPASCGS